jgi:hypothetical protein
MYRESQRISGAGAAMVATTVQELVDAISAAAVDVDESERRIAPGTVR